MTQDLNTSLLKNNCIDIEPLLYSKDDELSPDEVKTLTQHLERCPACQSAFDSIRQQQSKIEFEPYKESPEYLIRTIQSRIGDLPKQSIDHIRPWLFRKQVQRILAAACILFFLVFSIEQVSTISRISSLESRVQKKSPASSLQYEKGELLVINHFISREELRTIAARHLNLESNSGFVSKRYPKSNWSLWQLGLTSIEKNDLINDLLNQVPAKIPLFLIGKRTNINSDRINSLLQNH